MDFRLRQALRVQNEADLRGSGSSDAAVPEPSLRLVDLDQAFDDLVEITVRAKGQLRDGCERQAGRYPVDPVQCRDAPLGEPVLAEAVRP